MVRGRTRTAEPESAEDNGLNLKALKEKKIGDLALIGKNFNIEGVANLRKQELIFAILQAQLSKMGVFTAKAFWKRCRTDLGFCALLTITTCPAPMIFTFLPPDSSF